MKRHAHRFNILQNGFQLRLLSLVAILLFLSSCQREITGEVSNTGGNGNGNGNGNPPAPMVTTSIKLLVLDENGLMVSNAKVQSGTAIVYSNQFGIAEFKNIRVTANKAMVKVTVPGYFEAYRTFPADSKECFGKIKLAKLGRANIVMANAGGEITVNSDCSILFPANAFVLKSDGSPYAGAVVVYAQYLQPEFPDFNILMPGDLLAEDNGENILKSYGMMNVELLGTGSVPLQLKSGLQATLKATIPSSLLSSAPATIPMWYFNTDKGVWLKEGSASRQGNQYVGKVAHFTWWNYDYAYPSVFISGIVKDAAGLPVVNSTVQMTARQFGATTFGFTNQDGYFRVPAPLNASIELSISGEGCNVPGYTQTVTTTNTDLDLGTITVSAFTIGSYRVSGTFTDCNNAPIASGRLRIFTLNNMFETPITNGQAAVRFLFCNDSLDALVQAEDFATGKVMTLSKKMYQNSITSLGSLGVCTPLSTKYIRYIVDNQLYYISGNNVDSLTSHYFSINGPPRVEVAHNSYANPLQINSDISFHTGMGTNVSLMMIKAYPNLSNMGNDRELSNSFENYSNLPGAINRGTVTGRQFDTGVNRWRYISVAYSVGQQ